MDELYIGLMSGTSLNGVDAVVVEFDRHNSPRLLHSHSEKFPATLYSNLQQLITTQATSLSQLASIDHELAVVYSLSVKKLLHKANLTPSHIQAIGCHGQTIYHQPEGEQHNSLQLGDPGFITETTGISVVADFRRRDMAVGGQGAPLVPAFHADAFASPDSKRVILNIGGIANITIIPPAENSAITGFDTGPGNTLMDQWAFHHLNQIYDHDGEWAASGHIIDDLLESLLADDYFRKTPPKSTGREYFNLAWLESYLSDSFRSEDVQATLLELTCQSIARHITQYARDTSEIYICGGGAHNRALRRRLTQIVAPMNVDTSERLGIDPDWVEAAAFAWLARQTLHQLPGNLVSVTGAKRPVVLGGVYRTAN
jgi:anhydro-N-acetylmuramic acid kinase